MSDELVEHILVKCWNPSDLGFIVSLASDIDVTYEGKKPLVVYQYFYNGWHTALLYLPTARVIILENYIKKHFDPKYVGTKSYGCIKYNDLYKEYGKREE